jgi:hypothetical protein
VDADVWARLAALEGDVLESGARQHLAVLAVTEAGVHVRTGAGRPTLLSRRALEEALPDVAAGEPLRRRWRMAPRLLAVLRAAGVGPPPDTD